MSGADASTAEENDDTLVGGSEDDLIYDASGNNTVDCGTGNDTYYTDTLAHFNQSVGCETFMQASTASVSGSRTAAMKKAGLDHEEAIGGFHPVRVMPTAGTGERMGRHWCPPILQ